MCTRRIDDLLRIFLTELKMAKLTPTIAKLIMVKVGFLISLTALQSGGRHAEFWIELEFKNLLNNGRLSEMVKVAIAISITRK
jgi:ribosomal protein S8